MKPIAEMTPAQAARVRYVLMDIDDTITRQGKLLPSSYAALWQLRQAGFAVVPVTGRPAGWCDCIARQWPVNGVVGENGALAFWEESPESPPPESSPPHEQPPQKQSPPESCGPQKQSHEQSPCGQNQPMLPTLKAMYHPNAIRNDHPTLRRIRERAFAEMPLLRDAKDQFARLFDIAIDFAEEEPVLPLSAAGRVRDIAIEEGASAKVSSIHVNIWMGAYDKLSMTELFLTQRLGWQGNLSEVVFVGDSPNDEPMFARFPLACAVANIRRYEGLISHPPAFVSTAECGDGFAEIAERLLELR